MKWRSLFTGAIDGFLFTLGFHFGLSLTRVMGKCHGFGNGKRLSSSRQLWLERSTHTDASTAGESPSGPNEGNTDMNSLDVSPPILTPWGLQNSGKPRVEKSRMIPVWWVHHDWDSRPFGSWTEAMKYAHLIHTASPDPGQKTEYRYRGDLAS
jgi:hypothetical protein